VPVGPGHMKPVFVRAAGRAAGRHQAGDHSHSGWPDCACWRIRRRRGRFGGHRRGVPGSPPGTRRHARPHQRAGPDGVGRLHERDTSGSRRRCHDARGHAAQQPPFDCQRGGVRGQAAAAEGQLHVDVGFWGGVVPGNATAIRRWRMGRPVQVFLRLRASRNFRGSKKTCGRRFRSSKRLVSLAGPRRAAVVPARSIPAGNPRSYRTWLETRPVESEVGRST
jgi:hypothetical protein